MKQLIQIFLIIYLIIPQSLSSQTGDPKINILTPNAQSFKIYGDIPVSLYTGTPQVGIPLHTVSTEYLNLDISLNYHASGFKPESHPSWVGLGWNLNVGGVISREIKGILDETKDGNYATNGIGYYYSYSALNNDNWYKPKKPMDTNETLPYRNMDIDTQPDIFSFNFLGYSGKFYLNHLGEWVVQCDATVKVLFNKEDLGNNGDMFQNAHFKKFTIIDDKGIKFVFGGENAIEYSQSMFTNEHVGFSYARGWQATSWYLKEIIPPVGDAIIFNYERGPYQSVFSCMGKNNSRSRAGQRKHASDFILGDYFHGKASGSIMSPVYLTSINCPSENLTISFENSKSNDLTYPETNYTDFFINNSSIPDPSFLAFDAVANIPFFNRNPTIRNEAQSGKFGNRFIWLKLDKISLKYNDNNVETTSKYIQFSYDENTEKRRKLSSATISYPSSSDPEVYRFEYNEGYGSLHYNMINEPEYLSEYGDHWGYANYKFMWIDADMINSPKAPVKERAKLGVLKKIIYPTKGYTMFVYENHDYSAKVVNTYSLAQMSPTLAGGLRIKKIITVSDNQNYTSKEYFYNRQHREGISSGILHSLPLYYTNTSLLFDGSGAHVTYSSVTEKYEDNSFKVTNFVTEEGRQRLGEGVNPVFDDAPVYSAGDGVDVPSSRRDMERGKVSDEYYCDSTGKVYKSTHYTYVNIGRTPSNYVRTLDPVYMKYFIPIPDNSWGINTAEKGASAFYYYCYSNKLSSVREIQYNKNSTFRYGDINMPSSTDIVMSTKNLKYDDKKQQIEENNINSDGKVYKTVTYYPYSVQSTDIYSKMINANMLSYPISQRKYVGDILQGGTDFVYSFLNNKHILLTSLKNVYSDNSSIINGEYKYNTIGKLIGVKDRSGLNQSYLWNYKGNSVKVILDNVSFDDLSKVVTSGIINCSDQNTNWESLTSSLRNAFPSSFIKQYNYNYKGNVDKIVKESMLSDNFVYDKNERLETVSDHNLKPIQKYVYNFNKNNSPASVYLNEFYPLNVSKLCPVGYAPKEGTSVKLDIPAGMYLSTISQEDANKKVRDKHMPELQEQANSQGECIVFKDIDLEDIPGFTKIQTSRAYILGDELILSYIYLYWDKGFQYSNPGIFRGLAAVGKIKDPQYIPKRTTFREYEMYGNIWTVWIAPTGYIEVMVSGEKNIWSIPQWQSGFQVGEARFPLN